MGSTEQATNKGVKRPRPVKEIKTAASRGSFKVDATPALVIESHKRLWAEIKGLINAGLKKNDEGELKIAKLAAYALVDVVKGERQAWGLTENEVHVGEEEIFAFIKDIDSATGTKGET